MWGLPQNTPARVAASDRSSKLAENCTSTDGTGRREVAGDGLPALTARCANSGWVALGSTAAPRPRRCARHRGAHKHNDSADIDAPRYAHTHAPHTDVQAFRPAQTQIRTQVQTPAHPPPTHCCKGMQRKKQPRCAPTGPNSCAPLTVTPDGDCPPAVKAGALPAAAAAAPADGDAATGDRAPTDAAAIAVPVDHADTAGPAPPRFAGTQKPPTTAGLRAGDPA
jgi:hypothetical protein